MIKSWAELEFWRSPQWKNIESVLTDLDRVKTEYYPPRHKMFQAFKLTPFAKTHVVILGQDPYHNGQATGLAFSANCPAQEAPRSLRNVLTEYSTDLGLPMPSSSSLVPWARDGVLLLNTAFTVLPGRPLSHASLGWTGLVEEVLYELSHSKDVVFVLWGRNAQLLAQGQIGGSLRVESAHPSPRSAERGFFGSRPFTQVNNHLAELGKGPIDWKLP